MENVKISRVTFAALTISLALSTTQSLLARDTVDYSKKYYQCLISTGGDSPDIYITDFQIDDDGRANELMDNFKQTFWKHRTQEGSAPACETRYPDRRYDRVGESHSLPWGGIATIRAAEELEPNWQKTVAGLSSKEDLGKRDSLIVRQIDEAPTKPAAAAPKPVAKPKPVAAKPASKKKSSCRVSNGHRVCGAIAR